MPKISRLQNLKSEMSQSEMKAKKEVENLKETKNSEISAKDFEIQNLKSEMSQSEMSQSEMKAKEKLESLRENLDAFIGKLYSEKYFVDMKIVCNEKTFACDKAVQWQ